MAGKRDNGGDNGGGNGPGNGAGNGKRRSEGRRDALDWDDFCDRVHAERTTLSSTVYVYFADGDGRSIGTKCGALELGADEDLEVFAQRVVEEWGAPATYVLRMKRVDGTWSLAQGLLRWGAYVRGRRSAAPPAAASPATPHAAAENPIVTRVVDDALSRANAAAAAVISPMEMMRQAIDLVKPFVDRAAAPPGGGAPSSIVESLDAVEKVSERLGLKRSGSDKTAELVKAATPIADKFLDTFLSGLGGILNTRTEALALQKAALEQRAREFEEWRARTPALPTPPPPTPEKK